MGKQLQLDFDNKEIVDAIKENSLYNWCITHDASYLLDEWDYEKNGNISPKTISYGNDLKVWWIKSYDDPKTGKHFNFSWQASVAHRKEGRVCPYLSVPAKKIFVGFNDLATTHPNLASEWNYELNTDIRIEDVTYGSTKNVYWNCSKHGPYKARISARAQGNGCPYCAGKQVLIGNNDLATVEPEIAKEWDAEKNGIGPESVTIGCITKYWWKCSKGHSWQTTPNARTGTSRTGCPICSNKQILVGYNDLATTHPRIASEWNYDRNDYTPNDVVAKSNKYAWWTCKFGHEFKAQIAARTIYNTGCSICNKERKTSFSEKAILYYLQKNIPDTEENVHFEWLGKKEVDIYIPSLKLAIEYDGAHWHKDINKDIIKDDLCKENNITLIRVREQECPIYESSSVKIRYGNAEKNISLDEAIIEIIAFINHECSMAINSDVNIERDYTAIMEKYITREKENSLALIRPDLAEEWDYEKNGSIMPELVSLYSNKAFWWICPKCGNNYKMMVNNRTGEKHSNCPVCASKKIKEGINDLATTHPELITEWDYEKNIILPTVVSKGSHKKAWWKCENGHSWETPIYVRTKMGCGCPTCAGQFVDKGNSFADLYPDLLEEWNYSKNERDPYSILPSSNIKFWWICKKCGYEWQQDLAHRAVKHRGCPLCAHQVLVRGINDLETKFPEVAKEWNLDKNELKPYEVSGGTNKKYWWKCSKCGHEWEAVVASRTKRGSKCPICRTKNN